MPEEDGGSIPPKADESVICRGKSILLFSDGTGNSSAMLLKTNVWRAYEAADLGPAPPDRRKQIAFYDDGVGTSRLRPLAMLGGIFGFGLKRNVLELYRFACRNYDFTTAHGGDEDWIYGFGFSRGAFTMRLVIALIATEGLVRSRSEEELARRSIEAYRRFRARFLPRSTIAAAITRAVRRLRAGMATGWRRAFGGDDYDQATNVRPRIRFMGVWDTVAAYGGPIVEITRAIDNWFFALSMPDYHLNEHVEKARHALALDDERDAFHPLVWDEVHEQTLIDTGTVAEDRLEQIWFAGMHADVGGGYPDESLSYVSLLWMLEEAEKAGLRTLNALTERYRALANSAGPLHDSRSGPGVYYRYQPRRLAALTDPPLADTRVHWEPERLASGTPRGLLRRILVHESVAARIASGTDRYAPIVLPQDIEIVPPQRSGEAAPQADNEARDAGTRTTWHPMVPLVSNDVRARLGGSGAARMAAMERVWDFVWWRRIVYFASLGATALLVSMPLWPAQTRIEQWCGDDRCVLPGVFSPFKAILPGFTSPWLDAFAAQPIVASGLIGVLITLLFFAGPFLERRLRARSHATWQAALGRGAYPADPRWRFARAVRRSPLYLDGFRLLKWRILPFVFALVLLAAGILIAGSVLTQWWLASAERRGVLCTDPARATHLSDAGAAVSFDTAAPCQDAGRDVRAGARYAIAVRVTADWRDRTLPADPGRGVADPPAYLRAFGFYRRVVGAPWLKPLVVVRRRDGTPATAPRITINALDLERSGAGCWIGSFTARAPGRLYVAVNDAVLPFAPGVFYANNKGSATIRVTEHGAPGEAAGCTPDLAGVARQSGRRSG